MCEEIRHHARDGLHKPRAWGRYRLSRYLSIALKFVIWGSSVERIHFAISQVSASTGSTIFSPLSCRLRQQVCQATRALEWLVVPDQKKIRTLLVACLMPTLVPLQIPRKYSIVETSTPLEITSRPTALCFLVDQYVSFLSSLSNRKVLTSEEERVSPKGAPRNLVMSPLDPLPPVWACLGRPVTSSWVPIKCWALHLELEGPRKIVVFHMFSTG
jgi:hypothetical protein